MPGRGDGISFSAHLDVPLPPARVFEQLADMAVLHRWNPNVSASRRTSGSRLAPGSTYESTIRRGPLRMTARSTLVAVEPERSVTYEGTISGFWSVDSLTFEPRGTGTRITFSNHSTPPAWLRPLSPLLDAAFQPQARKAVDGARRHLEPPARGPAEGMDLMHPDAAGYAGYKDYTPTFLRIYDLWVIGVMARWVWRTPVQPMVAAHERHVGKRHLDVGPGTGYLLAHADLPDGVELTLLDPNPDVLEHAASRLAARSPRTVQASVLDPLPDDGPYDSASLSNVLHCLPGPMPAKAQAVRHVADVLTPDGVLVGSTVLGLDEPHTPQARAWLRVLNRRGAFDNRHDTVAGLRAILEAAFSEVEVEVLGSLALFTASRPR